MKKKRLLVWMLPAGLLMPAVVMGDTVGTAFTYQGQLQEDDGSPVSDPTCDFTFELWADEVSVDPGDLIGTESKLAVGMTDGLFTVTLNFGVDAFAGDARWLEIEARCPAGGGVYEPLSPRQAMTPVPNALYASDSSSLQLPFSGSAEATSGPVFSVINTATSGDVSAGYFESRSGSGGGVAVEAYATGTAIAGVYGHSDSPGGQGVHGTGTSWGGYFESDSGNGVRGVAYAENLGGVVGHAYGGARRQGFTDLPHRARAWATVGSSRTTTITDTLSMVRIAVLGATRWYFQGNVDITGNLSKGGGSFKIDHPLDPANKYLYHSFVESPDMMNVYNGNVVTDANGDAEVSLPEWFETLNKDFQYQLTVVGQFAQAIVAGKVKDNRFTIKTDRPDVEVSWQVTGIRRDSYAQRYRIPVEEDKPEIDRGKYLHPELYGQSRESAVHFAKPQEETSDRPAWPKLKGSER